MMVASNTNLATLRLPLKATSIHKVVLGGRSHYTDISVPLLSRTKLIIIDVGTDLDPVAVLLADLQLVLGHHGEGVLHELNLHVQVYLDLPELLLGLHDDPDVVKVVDGSVQLLVDVGDLSVEHVELILVLGMHAVPEPIGPLLDLIDHRLFELDVSDQHLSIAELIWFLSHLGLDQVILLELVLKVVDGGFLFEKVVKELFSVDVPKLAVFFPSHPIIDQLDLEARQAAGELGDGLGHLLVLHDGAVKVMRLFLENCLGFYHWVVKFLGILLAVMKCLFNTKRSDYIKYTCYS